MSFVYVQSGQPFAKKGRAELVLPKMDIPVALVEWEMFVPDRYRVRRFDGNAMLEPAPVSLVEGHGSECEAAWVTGMGKALERVQAEGLGAVHMCPGPGGSSDRSWTRPEPSCPERLSPRTTEGSFWRSP